MRLDHLLSKESKVSVLCIVFRSCNAAMDGKDEHETQDFSFSARRVKEDEAEHTRVCEHRTD